MDLLLAIGIFLLAVLGCFLFVPFHFVFSGAWVRDLSAAIGVHWLFGLWRMNYDLISRDGELFFKGRRILRWKGRLRFSPPQARRLPGRFRGWRGIRRYLKIQGRIRGVIGLEDPAATAWVFGAVSGLSGFLPVPLSLSADFEGPRMEWEWEVNIRVITARMILPLLRQVRIPEDLRSSPGFQKGERRWNT